MRTLKRNGRAVTYENVIGTEPIKDAYGNDTLEVRKIYSAPVTAYWNVSAAVGEEANEIFGDLIVIKAHNRYIPSDTDAFFLQSTDQSDRRRIGCGKDCVGEDIAA